MVTTWPWGLRVDSESRRVRVTEDGPVSKVLTRPEFDLARYLTVIPVGVGRDLRLAS